VIDATLALTVDILCPVGDLDAQAVAAPGPVG